MLLLVYPLLCYNRKAEVEQEPQKKKQVRNLESPTFTRMAQQHHHESLSQHLSNTPKIVMEHNATPLNRSSTQVLLRNPQPRTTIYNTSRTSIISKRMQEALSRRTQFAESSHIAAPLESCLLRLAPSHSLSKLASSKPLNIRRSSRINLHDIRTTTTSKIKHVEVNTLTIDQSRIKERHTLQIRISMLPSARLFRFLNSRAPTRFRRSIKAHRADTRTTPTPHSKRGTNFLL